MKTQPPPSASSLPKAIPLSAHIFVCTNERPAGHARGCCKSKGSEEVLAEFKAQISKAHSDGHLGKIRAQKAGCLDTCEWGTTVTIYPENIWYGRVMKEDVSEIVESHLRNGIPVERLKIEGK